jgi:hypothetical protein
VQLLPQDEGAAMTVETGRTQERASKLCEGCGARLTLGSPKANDTWPARLTLTVDQRDLLLIAAAEYRDLCDEAGEYQDVIQFVDWLSPSVLEEERQRAFEAEIRHMRKLQHEQARSQNQRDMRRTA